MKEIRNGYQPTEELKSTARPPTNSSEVAQEANYDKAGERMPIDDAIKTLGEMYETALAMPFVFNPVAWALYQTWKVYDLKGKKSEENG